MYHTLCGLVNRQFAQLLPGLQTGHPVTVGQSPAHESHTEQSETETRKTAFCSSETLKSHAGDWTTVTGFPVSNPGNIVQMVYSQLLPFTKLNYLSQYTPLRYKPTPSISCQRRTEHIHLKTKSLQTPRKKSWCYKRECQAYIVLQIALRHKNVLEDREMKTGMIARKSILITRRWLWIVLLTYQAKEPMPIVYKTHWKSSRSWRHLRVISPQRKDLNLF